MPRLPAVSWSMILLLCSSSQAIPQEPPNTPPAAAQTFTVRLLNAKTGKAMGNKKVTVEWVEGLKSSEILVDSKGAGKIEIPPATREFLMTTGPRIGNEPYRLAYINCNEPSMALIQITQVLEEGVVPGDGCGNQSVPLRPGEIIFWALPLPWWEPDFQ